MTPLDPPSARPFALHEARAERAALRPAAAVAALCTLVGMLAVASVSTLTPRSPVSRPLEFVYRGAGCDGRAALPQFERFIGRQVDGVVDFLDYSGDWARLLEQERWSLGCWSRTGRRLALALPLAVTADDSLERMAAGDDDGALRATAETLVRAGFASAWIRPGWEFNGGWYPWAARRDPGLWRQAFRRAIGVMRAVPGARFRFIWNPSLGRQQVSPDRAYPGDDVVDAIGVDVYNQAWGPGSHDAHLRWVRLLEEPWGLADVAAFARRHGKPLTVPEWGTGSRPDGGGGGDDPSFVCRMGALISASVFSGYWDFRAPDYDAELSSGRRPRAAAAFRAVMEAEPKLTRAASRPSARRSGCG